MTPQPREYGDATHQADYASKLRSVAQIVKTGDKIFINGMRNLEDVFQSVQANASTREVMAAVNAKIAEAEVDDPLSFTMVSERLN